MATSGVDVRKTHLVNRYFTPLAVLLVTNGVILGQPPFPQRDLAFAFLILGIAFNYFSNRWIDRSPASAGWKLNVRIYVNIAVNVVLVYLLRPYWAPSWLLLLLGPLASAMYGQRAKALGTAFFNAAALLAIGALRGYASPIEWAQELTYGLCILLLSLAVYELSQAVRGEKVDERIDLA